MGRTMSQLLDHVATIGPNGSKIVQYFVCKKFNEMTPNERFQNLRQKRYCIQCLFPGALQNRRRHENGQCQRDFVYPHPAHSKYPVNKHVFRRFLTKKLVTWNYKIKM